MRGSDLSFLVVGAGAIGGITAALLRKDGYDVEIVCKYDDYASLISRKGIHVTGVCGEHTVIMPAYASISEVKGRKDIILLATKATDMLRASEEMLDVLAEDGFVISMQNGICEEAIAGVVGKERVIGCVTGWGATMEKQGELIMTSTGDFILGYTDREADDFLLNLAGILSSVVTVRTTGNIMGHLYAKLVINSCITSLGAICGLYLGEMLYRIKIRRIFIEIIREAMNVADAMGIRVELFSNKLDLSKFQNARSTMELIKCHLILLVIGYRYRKLKSSSLQSLQRGKPAEIDYLNGYIVENGIRLGISVPVNMETVKIIHGIEGGLRQIGTENFTDPFFDAFN